MMSYEIIGTVVTAVMVAFGLKRVRLPLPLAVGCAAGTAGLYALLRLTILNPAQALTTAIFVLAYALIASERLHQTTVAVAGAVTMLLVGLIHQEEAFHGADGIQGVDWNTIFLLIGMMVIVNITQHTGVFQWVAIKAAKLARGEPLAIILLLSLATAVLSAALDNVTTVLLVAPITILVFESLKADPVRALICVILASNIGGTATLIGDPPNIMIASAARLSFLDFLRVDGPVILIVLAAFLATMWLTLRRRFHVTDEQRAHVMVFDDSQLVTDHRLLRRCMMVAGVTLLGFLLHGWLGLEPATVALAGAALMMLMHHEGPEEALREVEWPTIFFFIGLFIMVSALAKAGVIGLIGQGILTLTHDNAFAMTMLVLWVSALASGIVGSVPFAATGTVLVQGLAVALHPEATTFLQAAHAPDVLPLWWALSLGACLGGNLTPVAAAANLVVTGIAAQTEHPITFIRFMKYGIPITLQGLAISSVWLWFLFLR